MLFVRNIRMIVNFKVDLLCFRKVYIFRNYKAPLDVFWVWLVNFESSEKRVSNAEHDGQNNPGKNAPNNKTNNVIHNLPFLILLKYYYKNKR